MHHRWSVVLVAAMLVLLVACARDRSMQLDPSVQLTMQEDGRTVVRVGACNAGEADFAGDDCFSGQVSLFDQYECLRWEAQIEQLGPVASHEAAYPLEIQASLPPGDYRLAYSTAGYGSAIEYFAIVERDGVRYLEAEPELVGPQTEYTIVTPD
jgi:hypothetical protein